MIWRRIERPFVQEDIEQNGQQVNLGIQNAEIESNEPSINISHTIPINQSNGDSFIRVQANVFKNKFTGFNNIRVSTFRNSQSGEQVLFRSATPATGQPILSNSSLMGVRIFVGNFSGERRNDREMAIIDHNGNIGVFRHEPF